MVFAINLAVPCATIYIVSGYEFDDIIAFIHLCSQSCFHDKVLCTIHTKSGLSMFIYAVILITIQNYVLVMRNNDELVSHFLVRRNHDVQVWVQEYNHVM